ncbi:hypothetical protein [Candidatus Palauibacter sp.]|uniref:hypothetical protein n=1 Tax=Candidatus Palauibacter sp. TaxID=3101350 RepID=UPI003B5CB68B
MKLSQEAVIMAKGMSDQRTALDGYAAVVEAIQVALEDGRLTGEGRWPRCGRSTRSRFGTTAPGAAIRRWCGT